MSYGSAREHPLALRAALEWLAARPQPTLDDVVRDLTAGRYGTGDDNGVRKEMAVAKGARGGTGEGGVGEAVDAVLDSVVAGVAGHTRHLYDLLGVLPGTTATADLLTAAGATRVDEGLGELALLPARGPGGVVGPAPPLPAARRGAGPCPAARTGVARGATAGRPAARRGLLRRRGGPR